MQPGDLITYRNTHTLRDIRKNRLPPVYSILEVNKDGTLQVQSIRTGRFKTIKRPEHYFVTRHTSPPEAP